MTFINARCGFFRVLIIMRNVVDIDSKTQMDMCFHQEGMCLSDCSEANVDGIYVWCDDCREYFICKGGSGPKRKCPRKSNWGFNVDTKQCQYKSPQCFPCTGRLHFLILHTLFKLYLI